MLLFLTLFNLKYKYCLSSKDNEESLKKDKYIFFFKKTLVYFFLIFKIFIYFKYHSNIL